MEQLFTLKGFWNGEATAKFTACIVKLKENTDHPMWWQNAFPDKEIQVIRITYSGQTWDIANEDGTGFYKVTKGMGSPSCGHASIANYEFVRYIPQSEMIIEIQHDLIKSNHSIVEEYQKKKNPVEYERLQSLMKHMESFQKMSPMEKIADINKNMVKSTNQSKKFHSNGKRDRKGKR